MKVQNAAVVGSQEQLPNEVATMATQYGLTGFSGEDHAMGGWHGYDFDNGSVTFLRNVLQYVETSEGTISKEVVALANKYKLGTFKGMDHAMGGRASFVFSNGCVNIKGPGAGDESSDIPYKVISVAVGEAMYPIHKTQLSYAP